MPFPAREVILSDEAEAALAGLRKRNSKIAKQILKKVGVYQHRLLIDVHAGDLVPLPLPASARALQSRHGPVEKLRCLDLPNGWRMPYSFYHVDAARYVVLLEVVDHAQYSKWFPGRRKFGATRA